jgi:hypothetical protein
MVGGVPQQRPKDVDGAKGKREETRTEQQEASQEAA